jgi:Tol biopolymer transport system component
MAISVLRFLVPGFGVLLASPLLAQATRRVSVDSGGGQGNFQSNRASISADGRYVVFDSYASNLVPGDTNGINDVFVRDLLTGTTDIVSVNSNGVQGTDDSRAPSISADGRYVAFQSYAYNLIPGDENPTSYDVFVRDRQAGTTEKVCLNSGEAQAHGGSFGPVVSADGRFVAFYSDATDLVAGDTNGVQDVFVRDRVAGTTERISVSSAGVQGNAASFSPSISMSADGRFVAFVSFASNLVPFDTNERDIFLRDRQLGTTERVNVATDGSQAAGLSFNSAMSADGRYVAFSSNAPNLVPGDTNLRVDAFVRDRQTGTTERVSLNSGEGQGDHDTYPISISADGRLVAMHSLAVNLVPGDTNGRWDVFVRNRPNGTTERVSVDSGGAQANGECTDPVISADGRWVAFGSGATNLVPGDTNGYFDVFVRDLDVASFTSLCDPGFAGWAPCPCSNPPAGPTRGCDNSSATGGAVLSASGVTHLSSDTLVFTTSGEKPTALSIVLQGNLFLVGGAPYGQGIRCVDGSLRRLYAKTAVGGSITAPDFGAGDLSVSAQSAAKGDPIQPGQPRWYIVYYRDPIVLGGCPSSSTFNATQTGQISWSP